MFRFTIVRSHPIYQKEVVKLTLQEELEMIIANDNSRWGIYVRQFAKPHSRVLAINAGATFYGASLGKLLIVLYTLHLMRQGTKGKSGLRWATRFTLRDEFRAPGTGILKQFPDGYRINLRDTLALMLIVSDTTAAKLLVANLDGPKEINRLLEEMGFETTRLIVKEGWKFEFGPTTPREMAEILRWIRLDREADVVLEFMRRNRFPYGMRRQFQPLSRQVMPLADKIRAAKLKGLDKAGWQKGYDLALWQVLTSKSNSYLAGKEGSFEDVRNEVGVLYAGHNEVLVSVCSDGHTDAGYTPSHPGLVTLGKIGKAVHDYYSR